MPNSPVDPSWLPSTVAQSTAALVGIVGGLLVGRFIGLDGEQRAAQRRLTEAQERRDAARSHRDALAARLGAWKAQDVLGRPEASNWLLDRQGKLGPLDRDDLPEALAPLAEEHAAPHLVDAAAAVARAFDLLEEALPEAEESPGSWEQVRAANEIPNDRWDQLREGVFERVTDRKRRAARTARRRQEGAVGRLHDFASITNPPGLGFAGLTFNPSTITPIAISVPHLPPPGLQQRLGDAEVTLRAEDLELLQAERAVRASKAPPGLRLAVSVLTILTLVGLVLPVYVLWAEPSYNSSRQRLAVLVGFTAGLLLLLAYLWGYAWRLSRGRVSRRAAASREVGG